MLAVQSRLPLGKPFRPRTRRVRRPFTPSSNGQPYRLPRDVRDRLASALAPFRNREAVYALATFLGRFWSMPRRIVEGFCIDRRALTNHRDLGLTERQVRSAIRVLEEIGFLDRALACGSKYKPTADGLRRKPIRFMFGSDYFPLFDAANIRARAARERRLGSSRSQVPDNARRASVVNFETVPPKCPKSHRSEAIPQVYLGHQPRTGEKSGLPPKASEPNPQLEAALDRLLQGIRQSRGG
jgi:hypothetical protein